MREKKLCKSIFKY